MVFNFEEEEKIQNLKYGFKMKLETQRHVNALEELKLELAIAQVDGRLRDARGAV